MKKTGKITKISGPLVVADNIEGAKLYDVVSVGEVGLTGEIIEIRENRSWIQVYEETSGLQVGEVVKSTHEPLSLELGPGILGGVFDGIQRPLETLGDEQGLFIQAGSNVDKLDNEKSWEYTALINSGAEVKSGDIIGFVQETEVIKHYIMIPYGVEGVLKGNDSGSYTVEAEIGEVLDTKTDATLATLKLKQKWPIRQPRPYAQKHLPKQPLITGTRVLDTLYPVAKGGAAAIPGPFGSGKSVTQQMISKWCDAQIIVYVGCGERGNEMTEVLTEFPELVDARTGQSLMERTILVANTSNMPVAAREASVYTGVTLAEYYRDMGYDVAMMADSTSRWAEAMREMSGRLEEMPGEGGYPAYLDTRINKFYERAGLVTSLGKDHEEKSRDGSITIIGAVSPPGGDLSEPVSQSTLGVTKVFWSLDASLANARHYPAINWNRSYSNYFDDVAAPYYQEEIGEEFVENIKTARVILAKETDLKEIIRIVGEDSVSKEDRILLKTAQLLREDYLQQNGFDEIDQYASLNKQSKMLEVIMDFYKLANSYLESNSELNLEKLFSLDEFELITELKTTPEDEFDKVYANNHRRFKLGVEKLKDSSDLE